MTFGMNYCLRLLVLSRQTNDRQQSESDVNDPTVQGAQVAKSVNPSGSSTTFMSLMNLNGSKYLLHQDQPGP